MLIRIGLQAAPGGRLFGVSKVLLSFFLLVMEEVPICVGYCLCAFGGRDWKRDGRECPVHVPAGCGVGHLIPLHRRMYSKTKNIIPFVKRCLKRGAISPIQPESKSKSTIQTASTVSERRNGIDVGFIRRGAKVSLRPREVFFSFFLEALGGPSLISGKVVSVLFLFFNKTKQRILACARNYPFLHTNNLQACASWSKCAE